jgi:hypothetical protein
MMERNVVDRHRFVAYPDKSFHLDVVSDSDPDLQH